MGCRALYLNVGIVYAKHIMENSVDVNIMRSSRIAADKHNEKLR